MEELILPSIISGDYWPGINEISFKLNNQDELLTNAKVVMNIKLNLKNCTFYSQLIPFLCRC